LIELLVVIVIILVVIAVALPTVLSAVGRRQVSEAARILRGTLIGARDKAIHDGHPSGIRLLPDPTYPISWTPSGTIDPYSILADNRIVPLEPARDYSEGLCTQVPPAAVALGIGLPYQMNPQVIFSWTHGLLPPELILVESLADPGTGLPNPPTTWFWNIRVGDQIQLNGTEPWYTVVGPMSTGPTQGNTELFVNAGPWAQSRLSKLSVPRINGQPVEYLALVNARDDNSNGWVDEGFDGVDNDGDGLVDENTEREQEAWHGAVPSQAPVKIPYRVRRRPAPGPGEREVSLSTSVVVDATTGFLTQERSRLPTNRSTGHADILLDPDGTVLPTVVYATPASIGMADAFYHFWLAERVDLANATAGASPPLLPIAQRGGATVVQYLGPFLQGNYGLLTLSTRTGLIVVDEAMPFDDPAAAATTSRPFNVNLPFTESQVGAAGS
jgi:hypothetical protein